ncbi:probable G-protein coupled receptor 63 [Eurytemora carolleeae]|uniref:probable G-protein coupled receptor 63 n=1 Tax=Eurytemora carolleeae TaxID=1294199 RepID=UPI000C76D5B6|nr:probable G-protein coupled receptor 63 [Eurytemora carolleeae]|eukprot:XP_023330792.1 probable G-protein coupled receptor 63 [Eurytemora affinis]
MRRIALLYFITSCQAELQRVTLTFKYVNGTWVPVVPAPSPPTYALSTKVIAALFLFLLFLISFFGNIILISTISSSLTLRRLSYNLLLLQLGIVKLFECMLNITLSIAYQSTQPWIFGSFFCSLNSMLMEIVPIVETVTLSLLTIDRTRALKRTNLYKKSVHASPMKWKLLLGLIWFISLFLSLPLLPALIDSWPFPFRYSCHPVHELAAYYGMVSGSMFIIPWVSFFVCSIMIYSTIQDEKRRENKEQRGQNKEP